MGADIVERVRVIFLLTSRLKMNRHCRGRILGGSRIEGLFVTEDELAMAIFWLLSWDLEL